MTIYILMRGERNEGGEIRGVYTSYESAVQAAMDVPRAFPGGWEHYDNNEWVNGCDFVRISIWTVDAGECQTINFTLAK